MNRLSALGLLCLLPLSLATMAMQPLEDEALAAQSGQDGVSLGLTLANSTVVLSELAVIDGDGIAGTHLGSSYSSPVSLVVAPTTYAPTQGLRLFNNTAGAGVPTVQPLTIDVDAGTVATPVLNVGIGLPTDLRRIRMNPFSLYVAKGNTSIFTTHRAYVTNPTGTLNTDVTEVVRIGANGVEAIFTSAPVRMNLQLGNKPQGHTLLFTSGALLSYCNDTCNNGTNYIEALSDNTAPASVKFNLALKANNQTTGFSLAGLYADINANGLVFGKAGASDKLDVVLGGTMAGTTGSQHTNAFNNLKNASIGNVGIVGVQIVDLQVKVSGF